MSRRILFIVNQLFQLMVAAQIKGTCLGDREADLLLIDSCAGMKDVYKNLQNDHSVFENIYITTWDRDKTSREKLKLVLSQTVKTKNRYDTLPFLPERQYDAVYLNEFSIESCLVALFLNEEASVPIFHFEEGYGSYLSEFGTGSKRLNYGIRTWSAFQRLFGQKPILSLVQGHYYFYPDLIQYKPAYKTYQIPSFDMKDSIFCNFVFHAYNIPDKNEFDRKYIFFEENIPDNSIDDFSLVMKIADKVGKKNLMVKLHPRRPVDRFSEHGIKVSRATGVPWEVILLQNDFSNKVLMTISSGAALSSRLYFNSGIETYMLFKLFDKISPGVQDKMKFLNYIDSFRTIHKDDSFFVPENMNEFFENLENEKK